MPAENIASLKFAIQSAKGTPAAAPLYGVRLAGGTLPAPTMDVQDFEETTGGQMREGAYLAGYQVEGAPEVYVPPNALTALLYAALGTVDTTGAGDPYTHVITKALTQPWLTFWTMQADPDGHPTGIIERFTDCKVSQLALSGESNRPLRAAISIMGLTSHYLSADPALTLETTNRFMYYDGNGALDLEGAAVPSMRSFTVTINRNGQFIPGASVNPVDVSEGLAEIEMTAVRLLSDWTLYNRGVYGGATPSNLAAVTTTILELGGAGVDLTFSRVAASRTLQIVIPRMVVTPTRPQPGTGNDPLLEDLQFRAYQPSGVTEPITATAVNGLATLS